MEGYTLNLVQVHEERMCWIEYVEVMKQWSLVGTKIKMVWTMKECKIVRVSSMG